MMGFAGVSLIILTLTLLMTAFIQLSSSLNELTKITSVVARAASVCTSLEDAEKQAQRVAESAKTSQNIEEIHTKVAFAGDYDEWQPGAYLTVTVTGKIHTIDPYITSGPRTKKVLVSVENSNELAGGACDAQVWNYLRRQGLTAEATAGIMGNMMQESGIDPTLLQNGHGPAAGICQWENYTTKSSRWKNLEQFAASRGKPWTDLQSQLDFMLMEMSAMPKLKDFRNLTDIREATALFLRVFERAADQSEYAVSTRNEYSIQIYNKFAKY